MAGRYSHLTGEPIKYPFEKNGQKIRQARKKMGLNQTKFGEAVGVSLRHVIRLEVGQGLPTPELRDRIVAESGTEDEIDARRMGRPSDDDDEESDVGVLSGIFENPSLDMALRMRASAKRLLRDAKEIEEFLAEST